MLASRRTRHRRVRRGWPPAPGWWPPASMSSGPRPGHRPDPEGPPARPGLDRVRLGRDQAQALRQHQRQRLGPHHRPLRQGRRAGEGGQVLCPHRRDPLRSRARCSPRLRCSAARADLQRRKPTSTSRLRVSSAPKQMHDEKLVSDQDPRPGGGRARDGDGERRLPEERIAQLEADAAVEQPTTWRRPPSPRPWTAS